MKIISFKSLRAFKTAPFAYIMATEMEDDVHLSLIAAEIEEDIQLSQVATEIEDNIKLAVWSQEIGADYFDDLAYPKQ